MKNPFFPLYQTNISDCMLSKDDDRADFLKGEYGERNIQHERIFQENDKSNNEIINLPRFFYCSELKLSVQKIVDSDDFVFIEYFNFIDKIHNEFLCHGFIFFRLI